MIIGIFGAGNIGGNLARLFAGAGEQVIVTGASPAAELRKRFSAAPAITVGQPEEVAAADLVVLAVPWAALPNVFRHADRIAGKIVLDVTNPYKADLSGVVDLKGEPSSGYVQRHLKGARTVKAFNTLFYKFLIDGARPPGAADRIAVPVAGDDQEAKRTVMGLIERAGFTAIDSGSIAQSVDQEPDRPLYNRPWRESELRAAISGLRKAAAK